MDSLIQEKVSQKANELTATYDEKLRNYEDRYRAPNHAWASCLILDAENKICSVNSLSPKTNCEIYVFRTKITKPNCSTTANDRVCHCIDTELRALNFSPDQEVVSKLAEVDMIVADLDRANSRIVALEHRNVSTAAISAIFDALIIM